MKTLLPVAMLLSLLGPPGCEPPPPPPLQQAQGTMYRKAEGHTEVLADGAVVHAGDQLRACVEWGRGHVSLLGQDGTGAITIYGSWPLSPRGKACAPFALAVDDAPGPETFWLIGGLDADMLVPIARPEDAIGWRFQKP